MVLTLAGSLTACSAKTISGETAPAAESSVEESSMDSSGSDAAADHSDAVLGMRRLFDAYVASFCWGTFFAISRSFHTMNCMVK